MRHMYGGRRAITQDSKAQVRSSDVQRVPEGQLQVVSTRPSAHAAQMLHDGPHPPKARRTTVRHGLQEAVEQEVRRVLDSEPDLLSVEALR